MEISRKLMIGLTAALLLQGSIYLYLDQVLFSPSASFQVSAATDAYAVTTGQAYYSRDRRYMAVIKNDMVKIFTMPGKKLVRTIELGQQRVSYFKWLEDRDLALMGLYSDNASGTSRVVLTHVNPLREGDEHSTTINNLPQGSKISDVAYSTATNVICMQVQTSSDPDLYRVYRTDANQDLTRTSLTTNRIGRIGVLYDQDVLFYDNLTEGTVIVRYGDGSWRVISPNTGKYSLVGVDLKNTIYIAKLNAEGLGATIFKGRLGSGFVQGRNLQTPMDIRHLKMRDIAEAR